jgi:hypothetical protein
MQVGEDLASSRALGSVKVASITTNEEDRDAHLRSPDFFGVERYPEITFESTRIEPIDEASSRVWGNLTMHGVTQEVKLDVVMEGTDTGPRVGCGSAVEEAGGGGFPGRGDVRASAAPTRGSRFLGRRRSRSHFHDHALAEAGHRLLGEVW